MAKGRPTKGNGTAGPKEFDTDDVKTLKETLISK